MRQTLSHFTQYASSKHTHRIERIILVGAFQGNEENW
jgi:hypothetical protein